MQLKIKPEFKSLIPQLQTEEYEQLKQNIIVEGRAREAILAWQGYIIDGHNRYEICTAEGLPYECKEMVFKDEQEVKEWILRNQLGRRNLTDIARIQIALKLGESIRANAKQRRMAGLKQNAVEVNLPQWDEKSAQGTDTPKSEERLIRQEAAEEIASIAGVGKNKVYQYQVVEREAPAPIKEAMESSNISINKAYEIAKEVKHFPQEDREAEAYKRIEEETKNGLREIDNEYKIQKKISEMISLPIRNYYYITEENIDTYVKCSLCHSTISEMIESVDSAIGQLMTIRGMLEARNKIRRFK